MALIDRTPRVTFHGEADLHTLSLEEIEAGIEDALLEEGLPAHVVITPLDEEGEPVVSESSSDERNAEADES